MYQWLFSGECFQRLERECHKKLQAGGATKAGPAYPDGGKIPDTRIQIRCQQTWPISEVSQGEAIYCSHP